jgi:hypothetical protein
MNITSQQKFRAALTIQIVVGIFLAIVTYETVLLLTGTANNELFGWLSLSGLGVGMSFGLLALLAFVIGADIFWIIFFVLWLLRKKMHIKSSDKALRLP